MTMGSSKTAAGAPKGGKPGTKGAEPAAPGHVLPADDPADLKPLPPTNPPPQMPAGIVSSDTPALPDKG